MFSSSVYIFKKMCSKYVTYLKMCSQYVNLILLFNTSTCLRIIVEYFRVNVADGDIAKYKCIGDYIQSGTARLRMRNLRNA
jgi:hypothetical protein